MQIRTLNEFLSICGKYREPASHEQELRDLVFDAWLKLIGHLVLLGQHELARQESESLIRWLRNMNSRDSADLLLCEFLLTSPLPEFRNPDEARRIHDKYPDDNEIAMQLAPFVECSKGAGDGLRILDESTRNGASPSFESLTSALLDLANRKPGEWSPKDQAALTKIRELTNGQSGYSSIVYCLIHEIESRPKSSSSKSQDQKSQNHR